MKASIVLNEKNKIKPGGRVDSKSYFNQFIELRKAESRTGARILGEPEDSLSGQKTPALVVALKFGNCCS